MAMDGGIKPIDKSARIIGQARTARCMVADNSALHVALELIEPGDVLVADAGGFLGNAVWGGLMTHAAQAKGAVGLVVDGAVRDSQEIEALKFACFSRGCVPAGPHKMFGGAVDCEISCGGVPVSPCDLIVGDGDGVTVVPFKQISKTYEKLEELKERERKALASLAEGGSLAEVYGVPERTEAE